MGFKDEVEEWAEEFARKTFAGEFDDAEANLGGSPNLPRGSSIVGGTYSEYDGGDETECAHKNVREIKLLTTTVRECIDCGKELK